MAMLLLTANEAVNGSIQDHHDHGDKVTEDDNTSICKTENNYWRHYRSSTKLGIDELAMMICRDVGCDLSYCQTLFAKPKEPGQRIKNCDS